MIQQHLLVIVHFCCFWHLHRVRLLSPFPLMRRGWRAWCARLYITLEGEEGLDRQANNIEHLITVPSCLLPDACGWQAF